jgi:7-keto-8-aminopelargonate synthetase-like enzyme
MSDLFHWLSDELQQLSQEGLLRSRREIAPHTLGRLLVDGVEAWDFASNDYLCLANDSRVVDAAQNVILSHGVGAKASPLVSGRTDLHTRLEQKLVQLFILCLLVVRSMLMVHQITSKYMFIKIAEIVEQSVNINKSPTSRAV